MVARFVIMRIKTFITVVCQTRIIKNRECKKSIVTKPELIDKKVRINYKCESTFVIKSLMSYETTKNVSNGEKS